MIKCKILFFQFFLWLIGTTAEGGLAGGNFHRRSINLNTGYGSEQEAKGIIEELFIHEGAHASLDGYHANVGLFSKVIIVWLKIEFWA